MPGTASSSSTDEKAPCFVRKSAIFCAVTGPTPGSVSSSSSVAVLSETGAAAAPGAPPPAAGAPTWPRVGTTTCSPSTSGAARFTCARSAFLVAPPARMTASAIREPCASRYRPGRRTAPTTSTTTRADGRPVTPASATGGGGSDAAVVVVPAPSTKRPRSRIRASEPTAASNSRRRWRRDSGIARASPRTRHAWVTLSCRNCDFGLDDQVDEPAGHDDRLPDFLAVQVRLHLLRRLRPRHQLVLRLARRGLDAVAHLAVHLQHQLERLPLQERLVGDRPRLLPQPLVAQQRPQLLRHVRRVGLDQRDGGLRGEAPARSGWVGAERVDELHHRCDQRVEDEAPADVVAHARDRLVRLPLQLGAVAVDGRSLGGLADDPPQPAQEPSDPLDALFGPVHVLVGGPDEEDVEAHRIRAVHLRQLVGRRHVPARLRHLRAALTHPALVEQALERLAEADQPELVHHLDEEARVEQVPCRVVDPADVLVDRRPEVRQL